MALRWRAEDRDEVRPLAELVGPARGDRQHLVQLHDVARLAEAACGECGAQQAEPQLALRGAQRFEHHAVAEEVRVHVEPRATLVGTQRKARTGAVGDGERVQEGERGVDERRAVDRAPAGTEQAGHDVPVRRDATQGHGKQVVAFGHERIDHALDRRLADHRERADLAGLARTPKSVQSFIASPSTTPHRHGPAPHRHGAAISDRPAP